MKPITLTKSRFKVALECPTKLAYCADDEYVNAKRDDEFLESLADGGHKIGALAQRMYPDGIEITARESDQQIQDTNEYLKREHVTLFEPTIQVDNCLIRVDILVKQDRNVQLIEVKSKSFDVTKDAFLGKKGSVQSEWLSYLCDVAFQYWLLRKAHPDWHITPYLMLLDPTAKTPMDGVGAMFNVERVDRHLKVQVDPGFDINRFTRPLLRPHNVSREVVLLLASQLTSPSGSFGFEELVKLLSSKLAAGEAMPPIASAACKTCEFYCAPQEATADRRSGWAECMAKALQLTSGVSRADTIFGLYQHRAVTELLRKPVYKLVDLNKNDLKVSIEKDKITPSMRHWLQVREARGELLDAHLERDAIRREFERWRWPIHFIDFETARPPLPFHEGFKPNQQLLFQFSHHAKRDIESLGHESECLSAAPGIAPSVSVVRALKGALENDGGTVVHWWDHERTVLLDLARQIKAGMESDKAELLAFIDDLIGTSDTPGRLADLGRLVANCAYFVGTGGSSSIKKVLGAVLRQSKYLRTRYTQPLYGTPQMPSFNFPAGWIWYREEQGVVEDPYELLGPISQQPEVASALSGVWSDDAGSPEFIASGGIAMVAYATLQDPKLSDQERLDLAKQLKCYCELDTLAMVMVYEHLVSQVADADS
jgi:hypothetical protein